MQGYANLYIRKIIDIVTLGMQNEGCRKYLDVQSVIGRMGLLRAFEISLRMEHVLNPDMSRTFRDMEVVWY